MTRKDRRTCFHPIFGCKEGTVKITAPVAGKEKGTVKYKQGDELTDVTVDQFLKVLVPEIKAQDPQLTTLGVIRKYCKFVCPRGFITQETGDLVRAESFCREYHVPPLGSEQGYLDYPVKLVDAFGVISSARDRFNAEEQRQRTGQETVKKKV